MADDSVVTDSQAQDDRPTLLDPQMGKRVRKRVARRRHRENCRKRMAKVTAKIVDIIMRAPKTEPSPPPAMLGEPLGGCCSGKLKHTNDCPYFVIAGRDWREGAA